MMDSFSGSYSEARGKFLSAACDANARICSYGRNDLRGRQGEPLVCDVAVLGRNDAERAAIVITGTHGIEGYAGSAVLHRWLTTWSSDVSFEGIKIVLVHAINAWAFSHNTRTTEGNVDLNRNFFIDDDCYKLQNPSYDRLAPFLHATAFDASENVAAYRAYKSYLDQNGWHIENEMMAGQSHRPDGLFYTGKEPAWSNRTFRRIVNEHVSGVKEIGFIDWHTGVGSFGEVVYLIFDAESSPEHATAANWWAGRKAGINAFNAGAIPSYEGLLCKAIRQELPAPRIAGAVIEFGTGDASATFRADRLDRWLSFEGNGDADYDQFRCDYKNACCPNDLAWRRLVLASGPAIMDELFSGVQNGDLNF